MLNPNILHLDDDHRSADPDRARADLVDILVASRDFVRHSRTLIALASSHRPTRPGSANN
ncbi:MAG TPA: hypothetical protein VGR05_06205 [Sphingomicrobium sp.]|nr:hypothetical protein [Sphingomicrobium sp.]